MKSSRLVTGMAVVALGAGVTAWAVFRKAPPAMVPPSGQVVEPPAAKVAEREVAEVEGGPARPPLSAGQEEAALAMLEKILAAIRELQQPGEDDGSLRGQALNRAQNLLNPWQDATAGQLRLILERLQGARDLDPEWRGDLINDLLSRIGSREPLLALELVDEVAMRAGEPQAFPRDLPQILEDLAERNSEGAMQWLEEHADAEGFSDESRSKTSLRVVNVIAMEDPAYALACGDSLEGVDALAAATAAGAGPARAEIRTEALEALRKQAAEMEDPAAAEAWKNAVLRGMGSALTGYHQAGDRQRSMSAEVESFEINRTWLESAGLTPGEMSAVIGGLAPGFPEVNAQWLDWLADRPGPGVATAKTAEFVAKWLPGDRERAMAWVSSQPDGPVREAAVISVIDTSLSRGGLALAKRAAALLPEGEARDAALLRIGRR